MNSMTGYGRADFSLNGDAFTVEIKSLNHRFLEIDIKLFDRFFPLELRIRDEIKKRFSRGSVKIYIKSSDRSIADLNANIDVARKYLDEIERIKSALNISGAVDVGMLLNFKDIFAAGSKIFNAEEDWQILKQGLNRALEDVLKMRKNEGDVLSKDILKKLDAIEEMVANIEKFSQKITDTYREKIKDRISLFLKDVRVDEARLLNEVAIFSDRCCVNEEIVRLKSHLSLFKDMLVLTSPVGRKMDFLCQEILRELNTIGSKTQDIEISHILLESKAELEKIREQIQNVE